MLIVYYSTATGNTRRFVEKLGIRAAAIPRRASQPDLLVDEPYVLVCPTYGGGTSISGGNTRPVPTPVIHFLNNVANRRWIRGVIAGGNSNFGPDFGLAGDVISAKCGVPYLWRFELMGNDEDVRVVRAGLEELFASLGEDEEPDRGAPGPRARGPRGDAGETGRENRNHHNHEAAATAAEKEKKVG